MICLSSDINACRWFCDDISCHSKAPINQCYAPLGHVGIWPKYSNFPCMGHILWASPLLLQAANHNHFQFLTGLHSDITEKFIFLLKIAGSNWFLVVHCNWFKCTTNMRVYIKFCMLSLNSQNQMPHLWGRFCGLKGEKCTHNSPSWPWRGVVGPNIDRFIT